MNEQIMQHFQNLKFCCQQALQSGVIKDFDVAFQMKISIDQVEQFLKDTVEAMKAHKEEIVDLPFPETEKTNHHAIKETDKQNKEGVQ